MEFITEGRIKKNKINIYYNKNEQFIPETVNSSIYRFILIENGSVLAEINGVKNALIPPVAICLNEKDKIQIAENTQFNAKSIYFMLDIINSAFNFDNINNDSSNFSTTENRDRYLLKPFVKRDSDYKGLINPGPDSFIRIRKLFDLIDNELNGQYDFYWPCRSRSYFIELLFLIEKIRSNNIDNGSLNIKINEMPEKSVNISDVILYINNNYKDKISLSSLAKMFSTNRTTLNTEFHKAAGCSVISYLIKLRLNVASMLLRDTKIPVGEVCERSGFQDQTYFGRIFKSHLKLTPTEYRDKYCWVGLKKPV